MADIVEKIEEITSLDKDIHWFCPRSTGDDDGSYFDEDVLDVLPNETDNEKVIRLSKIQQTEERRNCALDACKILAYDGGDATQFADRFLAGLEVQLTRCDVCVRQYHRSRDQLQLNLETLFEAEEVRLFMEKFDDMNKRRIYTGLNMMTEMLFDLPPEQRNIMAAGDVGMYAMFEALNCVPFLQDEDALQKYFDKPLKLVQTKKKVKLPSYAPGMTAFLFSENAERSAWALRNYGGIKRPMTGTEFDFSVKPFLEQAMSRVGIINLELEFLPRFWRGTRAILQKMPKEVVTNGLRAMDANLYTIAMEHFQVDAAHFTDMVASYQTLLELSPSAFWDAMGTISPQSVVENIFRSPVLEEMCMVTDESEPLQLKEKLAWTEPFVRSIKPANLVPPVRALLEQLFKRFQQDRYSHYASSTAWASGLVLLLEALKMLKHGLRGGPVATHLLEVVARDYIQLIMQDLEGIEKKDEQRMDDSETQCLQVLERALALDVQSLAYDRATIVQTKGLDHELGVSGLNIWKMSMRAIRPGHPGLAAAIVAGIVGLLPLEKLTSRQVQIAPKPAEGWNNALNRVLVYTVDDFLERLQVFSPDQLSELYNEQQAAAGLIALLFSGEQRVHQPTLAVLKILSGQDSRRETMLHLVDNTYYFHNTLDGVNSAMKAVVKTRVFGPCPILLKLCTDLFSSLCNTPDGVLRTRTIKKQQELEALEEFWQMTWKTLNVIFEQTEPWSNLGYDKAVMQDFCRETMDFADYAFDQYSIIANTLRAASTSTSNAKGIGKQLLEHPKTAFSNVTKWLRLRDEYLISKAVGLTSKMLLRLQMVGIEVDSKASENIEGVLTGKIKTKLSRNQQAEIQQALEKHLGATVAEVIDLEAPASKRQSSLAGWASAGGDGRSSTPPASNNARKGTIDVEAWSDAARRKKLDQAETDLKMEKLIGSVSSTADAYRRRADLQGKKAIGQATVKAAQQQNDKKMDAFKLKRQQEKEAAEKARVEALAKAKGIAAGSALVGLGDIGKDHSLKGINVMISSGEESEDDDDDLEEDLFGDTMKERKKIRMPELDPKDAVLLKSGRKGPTRIQRTQRSANAMRARMKPNLDELHTTVLKWDFFHTGDYPPGMNEYEFQAVANSFTDPRSYQNTFKNLLTLEAWQGMVKAREENASKAYEVKVQNRSNVDAFIELSSIVSHQENRELQLQEGDIVLFSKAKKPTEDPSAPHCLARIYRLKRQKAHIEVIYQIVGGTSLAPSLTMQALVCCVKVQSIIPLEREFGALHSLEYYDLCQQIIKARPSNRIKFTDKQIQTCQDVWNVNKAQSEAINAALENEGFSLIQGPPGSGKTKTIVAIVGGLLSSVLGASNGAGTRIAVPGAATRTTDSAPKKLLVCAPSNAAVDELVMRLKEGVKTKSGRHHELNIVRIGRSDAINTQVLDVTMDELVAKRLGNSYDDQRARQWTAELFQEHEKVSAELRDLYQKQNSGDLKGEEAASVATAIGHVRKRKNDLGVSIDNVRDQEKTAGREAELNKKRAQQVVLEEAHVICATLSGSGHEMFTTVNIEFETVIIDEAAQCVEMSSLIPLKYGCVKCIMVGDPKQLPPTVFSKEAARFQYEQSLFVRMQNNFADEVHLLDTQYRMHPDISVFPSQTFYDSLLKDGPGMRELRKRPWHGRSALLAPYRFFDVVGTHASAPKGHSLVNHMEVEVAMALFNRVTSDCQDYDFKGRIGIITPYKSQLRLLKDKFSTRFGSDIFDTVEFNTTDAFQGRESEIIVFSCVRASPAGGIGFLQDIRRMNVGLTRAKSSLWVLGNSQSLIRGRFWKLLVEDAQNRHCYESGDIKRQLNEPSSMHPPTKMNNPSMPSVGHSKTNGRINGLALGTSNRPQPAPTPTQQLEHADSKMEGVSYRFEDRANKKRPALETSNDDAVRRRLASEDVEMADVDSTGGTATPLGGLDGHNSVTPSEAGRQRSEAETALSAVTGEETVQINGGERPRVAPFVAQQVVRKKKKPADPFLTRKR